MHQYLIKLGVLSIQSCGAPTRHLLAFIGNEPFCNIILFHYEGFDENSLEWTTNVQYQSDVWETQKQRQSQSRIDQRTAWMSRIFHVMARHCIEPVINWPAHKAVSEFPFDQEGAYPALGTTGDTWNACISELVNRKLANEGLVMKSPWSLSPQQCKFLSSIFLYFLIN